MAALGVWNVFKAVCQTGNLRANYFFAGCSGKIVFWTSDAGVSLHRFFIRQILSIGIDRSRKIRLNMLLWGVRQFERLYQRIC
jgi:hypothetical protein